MAERHSGILLKAVSLGLPDDSEDAEAISDKGLDILVSLQAQGGFEANEEIIESLDGALKHNSTFHWNTARTVLKLIGTGLLTVHIFHHSFIIEPGWAAIYFAISCSISILLVELIDPAIDRIFRTQPMDYAALGEKVAETVLPHPLRLAIFLWIQWPLSASCSLPGSHQRERGTPLPIRPPPGDASINDRSPAAACPLSRPQQRAGAQTGGRRDP